MSLLEYNIYLTREIETITYTPGYVNNTVLYAKFLDLTAKLSKINEAVLLFKEINTLRETVNTANNTAALSNSNAKAAKVIFDAAKATYTTNPTEINLQNLTAAEKDYDTKLAIAVDDAANASELTMQLNSKTDVATQKALEGGYVFPISTPSDSEILDTLTQLINEGCVDVSEIQTKITEIVTTSNTFNTFIEKMSVFNDYETVLEVRLKQIFNFLSEDGVIDAQEIIVTTLRTEIIKAIANYKKKVMDNNTLATQVNSMYHDIEERLNNLHTISQEIETTMNDVEKIIDLKRGGQTFAKKLICIPILSKTYNINDTISFVVTNMTLLTGTNYKLRYNFEYNDATKLLTWKGTQTQTQLPETLSIEVKLEVMSTSHNAYDTTSMFSVIFKSPANQIREKTISCVSTSGNIIISRNETIQFCFKNSPTVPLTVKNGMVTICLN